MSTSNEESPRRGLRSSWPLKFFATARSFNCEAENTPYVEWLKECIYSYWESEDSFEDRGDYEGGGSHQEEGSQSLDFANDGQDDAPEDVVRDLKEVDKLENCSHRGIVRRFMEGFPGDEDCLHYPDQVGVVAEFCKQVDTEQPDTEKKEIILLDIGTNGGGFPRSQGQYQRYLDPKQLREELSKPRFIANSQPKISSDDEMPDVEKRILFLPDLNPSTMKAIIATAPRSHALALKNFFFEYLTSKASIGVTLPIRGFKIFTFNLNIPFYTLGASKELIQDTRMALDGRPLRRSWTTPFISNTSTIRSARLPYCLYEAQISITVTGIDHRVWTAYGAFDTYFRPNDTVAAYHHGRSGTRWLDPLSAGQINSYEFLWTPREYFFKVFEIRINQVRRQWWAISRIVEDDIRRRRNNTSIPLNFNESRIHQGVNEVGAWSNEMVMLLRRLGSRLADIVEAWDKFQRKDIRYFLYDDESPTASSLLKCSVDAVDTCFLDLKGIQQKLRKLEKELCQDFPQGVNTHLSHGNHETQIVQQQSALQNRILIFITIAYLPLTLATSIFSVNPGALPFTPNFGRFVLCLFALAFLVVVSIAALLKWQLWCQLFISLLNLHLGGFKRSGKVINMDNDLESGLSRISHCSPH